MAGPLRAFIIYSSRDRELRDTFLKHIKPLIRAGKIRVWSDADIPPGEPWSDEIREKLEETELFIPLVSVHFFDSKYIEEVELPFAEEQRRLGRAFVVPVLLNHCSYKHDPIIGVLEVIPKDKPITSRDWESADAAWTHVVEKISSRVDQIRDDPKFQSRREDAAAWREAPEAGTQHKVLQPDMVFIRGGTFQMGSEEGSDVEKPVHSVTVGDFYMGRYEVTVAEFKRFIDDTGYITDAEKNGGEGSSIFINGQWELKAGIDWRCDAEGKLRPEREYHHPVVHVSWNDAVAYCDWLSRKTGRRYRLPTEAEWEYAAGNGSRHTKYSWGDGAPSGRKGGNVADETAKKRFSDWTIFPGYSDGYVFTAPVGSFAPNDFGLYDMSGNVSEWCNDWYIEGYYRNSPSVNPTGPSSGAHRVVRGGSWGSYPEGCRVASRGGFTPDYRAGIIGFRLALVP